MDKTQSEINDEEWNNPDNWGGVGIWRVYFSKRDSRVWVPHWWNGSLSPHIINLGHRWGFFTMSLIFYAGLAMVSWIGWLEYHHK
jgi:hypothetical protein